jgi:glycosyltransferase involved in cell wall biosynthesis
MRVSPRQKIDMVSANADPRSPANVFVGGLATALAAAGHDVTVWTRRDRPDLRAEVRTEAGVTVRHVDAGPARAVAPAELLSHLPAFATALRTAWDHERPQVVHAHSGPSALATLGAMQGRPVPVVQTFHGGTPERRVATVVDAVVATASDEVDALLAVGVPRSRIAVVPPGIDAAAITPDGPAHPRGDRPRVVAAAGLDRGSGVAETIVAIGRVPQVELVVVGGRDAHDPDIERLRGLAAAGGVDERVRFVGPVARRGLPAVLRSADVVVCLPWSEPCGVVALTAMACGRPVVASAVGVLADAVVDGVTGILVPPRRLREPAAALRHILASPAAAMAMGTAGRDRAETRYGWDRSAATAAAVYAGLCAEPELIG